MDRENVTIHYDGLFKDQFTVTCDCGVRFKFQSRPTRYCPSCGGKITRYVADNVPMDKVPDGYKYYLFDDDKFADDYFHDISWRDIIRYQAYIYSPDNADINIGEEVFNGWCYEHNYDPVFYRDYGDKSYMGYENTKGTFVPMTFDAFRKKLIKEIEKIKNEKEEESA